MNDVTEGWPFLVARGRRTGHRTILAPGFLIRHRMEGLLAGRIGGSGPEPPATRIAELDADEAGPITVFWTTDRLVPADLAEELSDANTTITDEHGRPLVMVYGVIVRGRVSGTIGEDDLRAARIDAVGSYRRFLRDETDFDVVTSETLGLRRPLGVAEETASPERSPSTSAPLRPHPGLPGRRRLSARATVVALAAAALLIAGGLLLLLSDGGDTRPSAAARIVASTSWAGAFARAAGAEDVTLVAPANLQDPARYEPKQSDLAAVRDADYVLYARDDRLAPRLERATRAATLIPIRLENSPAAIRAEVLRLARRLDTTPAALRWLDHFEATYRRLSRQLRSRPGVSRRRVVSHRGMAPWVAFAGMRLVATYGPAALTPEQIGELADAKPDLVVDDAASPVGRALRSRDLRVVELSNVPGARLDLVELFRRNAKAIDSSAKE